MAEYADICAWNPEGTLFQILDEEKFICQILPRHFKHNKLNSFIRQVIGIPFSSTSTVFEKSASRSPKKPSSTSSS